MGLLAALEEYEVWTLCLTGAGILATIVMGSIAIWGDRLRHFFNRPALQLTLDPHTFVEDYKHETGEPVIASFRYVHLHVENHAPWSPANNVMVYLKRIERLENGHWKTIFETGPVPLLWQFSALKIRGTDAFYGVGGQVVGPKRICDFGCFEWTDEPES